MEADVGQAVLIEEPRKVVGYVVDLEWLPVGVFENVRVLDVSGTEKPPVLFFLSPRVLKNFSRLLRQGEGT